MKEIDLTHSIRTKANFERRLVGPDGRPLLAPGVRTTSQWPMCAICLKEVDSVNLENVNSKSCEIRAKHHGAEDSIKVRWGVPVQAVGNDVLEDPNVGWAIKRAMGDALFFKPEHQFDFSSKRS